MILMWIKHTDTKNAREIVHFLLAVYFLVEKKQTNLNKAFKIKFFFYLIQIFFKNY
jgi:hypothetical protein